MFRLVTVLAGINLITMKSRYVRFTYIISILTLLLTMPSCVHEMPGETESDVYVDLLFNMEAMPTYQEIDYHQTRGGRTSMLWEDELELRYLIRCYPANDDGTYAEIPCSEFRYTNQDLSELDYRCKLSLLPGKYRMKVWTDYIREGAETDFFYNTSSFADISIKGGRSSYQGSTDYRTAFIGEKDVEVLPVTDFDAPVPVAARIEMIRPMAKFKFVTTDMADFIEKYLGITDPDEAARVDFSDYQIVFRYTGFLPTHFNMFSDKPFDSEQDYSFISGISDITSNEATLGFDYIFVNGHASRVSVAIGIYNNEGELLSFSPPIEVPLMRNKQTIVRGKFLTTNTYGMITINSEYDGSYEIIVY